MDKQQAIDLAGSATALAKLLNITPSAITQWEDEVPPHRVWQLKVIKPGWFRPARTKPTQPETRACDEAKRPVKEKTHAEGFFFRNERGSISFFTGPIC